MDIFADSRSEMKISIRNAASGYENELRWGLQDIVNEKTAILQDIQTAYEELFQISNRSYIPSSPTLQEVSQAMSKGVNMFSSSLGGFADKLVSMAQIDSSHTIGHFSDLFKTDCSLENWDELSSDASDY